MEFNAVMGHDHQKGILATLVEKDKLPHALLFSGPGGTGKRSLAVELVKNLFCEKKKACNNCRACRNLDAGVHPDFMTLSGDGAIKIDEMRAIKKEVCEPPYEAPIRIILIDDAERMTREAANALLKTLEEPPPSNLFILVTSQEQLIPLTIRSRCMRLGFGPLSPEIVRAYFDKQLKADTVPPELLAAISNGSITTGLFWMDEENFAMRRLIADALTADKRHATNAALISERITALGYESEYLSFLLSFLRDVWWMSRTGDSEGLVNKDLSAIIEERAMGRTRWAETSIDKVQETIRTIRYNVNRWLALEYLMHTMMGQGI